MGLSCLSVRLHHAKVTRAARGRFFSTFANQIGAGAETATIGARCSTRASMRLDLLLKVDMGLADGGVSRTIHLYCV